MNIIHTCLPMYKHAAICCTMRDICLKPHEEQPTKEQLEAMWRHIRHCSTSSDNVEQKLSAIVLGTRTPLDYIGWLVPIQSSANTIVQYQVFAYRPKIPALAVVGSIVWTFRRLKKPRCREMSARSYALHSVCPKQINFPLSILQKIDIRSYILDLGYIG